MKFTPTDAYIAVRTKQGKILKDPDCFADPEVTPIIIVEFQLFDDLQIHKKIGIYHQDLDEIEIIDLGMCRKESSYWKVVMEGIETYINKEPRPLHEIMLREMHEEMDLDFINTQRIINGEPTIKMGSAMFFKDGIIQSEVRQ